MKRLAIATTRTPSPRSPPPHAQRPQPRLHTPCTSNCTTTMTISSTTTATNTSVSTSTGYHVDDGHRLPPSTDARDRRQHIADPSIATISYHSGHGTANDHARCLGTALCQLLPSHRHILLTTHTYVVFSYIHTCSTSLTLHHCKYIFSTDPNA